MYGMLGNTIPDISTQLSVKSLYYNLKVTTRAQTSIGYSLFICLKIFKYLSFDRNLKTDSRRYLNYSSNIFY